jgi:hypothetical protein
MTILHFTEIDGAKEYIVLLEEDKGDLSREDLESHLRPGYKLIGKIEADVYEHHVLPMERELYPRY